MTHRRFLPKYVSSFTDRHGKMRYQYRRKGRKSGYFSSALGSEKFRAEYYAYDTETANSKNTNFQRPKRSTIGDLKKRYMSVPDRLGPSKVTQQKVGAVIEDFCKGREERLVSQLTFEHLDAIIAKKKKKTVRNTPSGPREVGGYFAAKKLRKELIRLFEIARKAGFCDHNVAEDTAPVSVSAVRQLGAFTRGPTRKFRNTNVAGRWGPVNEQHWSCFSGLIREGPTSLRWAWRKHVTVAFLLCRKRPEQSFGCPWLISWLRPSWRYRPDSPTLPASSSRKRAPHSPRSRLETGSRRHAIKRDCHQSGGRMDCERQPYGEWRSLGCATKR